MCCCRWGCFSLIFFLHLLLFIHVFLSLHLYDYIFSSFVCVPSTSGCDSFCWCLRWNFHHWMPHSIVFVVYLTLRFLFSRVFFLLLFGSFTLYIFFLLHSWPQYQNKNREKHDPTLENKYLWIIFVVFLKSLSPRLICSFYNFDPVWYSIFLLCSQHVFTSVLRLQIFSPKIFFSLLLLIEFLFICLVDCVHASIAIFAMSNQK